MQVTATEAPGLFVIEPKVLRDARGFFLESFNQELFRQHTGMSVNFVQDNHSQSAYGTLRGLHFQRPPYAQAKLVRVVSGEVLDIVVDLRRSSPTFGRHFSVILSAENQKQFFVPRGFAHGFVVLSEKADFLYKCDNYYMPSHDSGIRFNDAQLGINWQIDQHHMILSDKDRNLPFFDAQTNYFE